MAIKHFAQSHSFLSNNNRHHPILFEGDNYKTVEHAYQAARLSNTTLEGMEYRKKVRNTFNIIEAQRVSRTIISRPDWPEYRIIVMRQLIEIKFSNRQLAYLLQETHPVDLEYGNKWHDIFWGICRCPACDNTGENMLGKILMEQRIKLLSL